jgi:hypothetical protein
MAMTVRVSSEVKGETTSFCAVISRQQIVPEGKIDGRNTHFLMPFRFTGLEVYVNGLLQKKGLDFLADNVSFDLSEPPRRGSWITCHCEKIEGPGIEKVDNREIPTFGVV